MEKVCVVIPVHSPNPSEYELVAFAQCFKILNKHPIRVLAPKGISLANYQRVVSNFEATFIHPKWQSSLLNYNKLKLSKYFYKLFQNYEFLLTYELDAFVFKDELDFWCAAGYDYIGAPFFEGYGSANASTTFVGVGNSGFSLRRVNAFKRILSSYPLITPLLTDEELKTGGLKLLMGLGKLPSRLIKRYLYENVLIQERDDLLEDTYILEVNNKLDKNKLKFAPVEDAIRFSFELRPEYLYKLNKNQLPMGCHAWNKYDFNFWKPYIESYGYSL